MKYLTTWRAVCFRLCGHECPTFMGPVITNVTQSLNPFLFWKTETCPTVDVCMQLLCRGLNETDFVLHVQVFHFDLRHYFFTWHKCLRFKRERQRWAVMQDSRCQSITRPRDLGEDAGDDTFFMPSVQNLWYDLLRTSGWSPGKTKRITKRSPWYPDISTDVRWEGSGGPRGQSVLSNQTGQDGICRFVRAVLFSALNTQPQPQAQGGHERTKEWRTV